MRVAKNGGVRGKSWTRQPLNDAWNATNLDGLYGIPWQTVAPELRLTKKVTADRRRRTPEVEPRRFYVLSADIEARGQEVVRVVQRWHRMEERHKPHSNECRERIRTIIERTLTGKARKSACKDRVAETERLKERMTARVERGAGDVPMEPRNEERMADRHAVESGEDEKQHEENRMRDVHLAIEDRRQQMKNNLTN